MAKTLYANLSVLLLLGSLILMGCAGGRVHDATRDGSPVAANSTLSRPEHIYVTPIDASQGNWKADANDLPALQTKVKADLEKDLLAELREIAPTTLGSGSESSGWTLTVTIIRVDPGSAVMRELVGLGAGQSKIDVSFGLVDHGQRYLSGQVDADTGAEMGLHSVVVEGNNRDASRVAREIRNYLAERLYDHSSAAR
jgi:Domain of unknown function (DUF4410)